MNKIISATAITFMLLSASVSMSQNPIPDWENPQMIGQNKEAAHVPLMPFRTVDEALTQKWTKRLPKSTTSRYITKP